MEKEYFVRVAVEWAISISGETEKQAIDNLKDIFETEHNIELKDDEIKEIIKESE